MPNESAITKLDAELLVGLLTHINDCLEAEEGVGILYYTQRYSSSVKEQELNKLIAVCINPREEL